MRKAFVDVGANTGKISYEFAVEHADYDIYCIEANPALIPQIHRRSVQLGRTFVIMWAAAWVYDGTINLYQSGANAASTVVEGKVERGKWPQIDYESPTSVPCFDLGDWMLRTFTLRDSVILKMDVEGAEYTLLEKMIQDRSLALASELWCEWHQDRYPAISQEKHEQVKNAAKQLTRLKDWG